MKPAAPVTKTGWSDIKALNTQPSQRRCPLARFADAACTYHGSIKLWKSVR
jgi:hypothetical protein